MNISPYPTVQDDLEALIFRRPSSHGAHLRKWGVALYRSGRRLASLFSHQDRLLSPCTRHPRRGWTQCGRYRRWSTFHRRASDSIAFQGPKAQKWAARCQYCSSILWRLVLSSVKHTGYRQKRGECRAKQKLQTGMVEGVRTEGYRMESKTGLLNYFFLIDRFEAKMMQDPVDFSKYIFVTVILFSPMPINVLRNFSDCEPVCFSYLWVNKENY